MGLLPQQVHSEGRPARFHVLNTLFNLPGKGWMGVGEVVLQGPAWGLLPGSLGQRLIGIPTPETYLYACLVDFSGCSRYIK